MVSIFLHIFPSFYYSLLDFYCLSHWYNRSFRFAFIHSLIHSFIIDTNFYKWFHIKQKLLTLCSIIIIYSLKIRLNDFYIHLSLFRNECVMALHRNVLFIFVFIFFSIYCYFFRSITLHQDSKKFVILFCISIVIVVDVVVFVHLC